MLKNTLGDGADALVAVAREMPQLITLCGITPEQEDIDLKRTSHRGLDAGDAKLLAFDLSKNQTIKTLNLANNGLCGIMHGRGTHTAEGINALCDALKGNSTLTSLKYASQLECLPTVNSL